MLGLAGVYKVYCEDRYVPSLWLQEMYALTQASRLCHTCFEHRP